MPRLELLKKAIKSEDNDSESSESTDFHIRKIRATRKYGNNKLILGLLLCSFILNFFGV